jgi:hypothetical protein
MKSFQFKRTQHKYRTRYKIANWAAYEAGLCQRGSVVIWLSEDVRRTWCHIRSVKRMGRRDWHLQSGLSKRSRAENVVYRYKVIIGREMKARTLAGQRREARIGCRILNTMARLGMPESYRAA